MEITHDELIYDAEGLIRIYKSGRVERFTCIDFVSPSTDPTTGVSSKDTTIVPGVSARLYIPKIESDKKLPILIHFHGGAFCLGSAFEPLLHKYMISLVARSNVIAVSVHYRLAPEHPIPVAYEDSYAALDWVFSQGNNGPDSWLCKHGDFTRLYVSGESAGGNIAHHVAMYGGVKIRGAVLIHPYFLSSKEVESEKIDSVITEKLASIWKIVCPSTTGLDDPWINPLSENAPPLSGLGCEQVLVLVGGTDTLRDRGRDYYEKLKVCGWKGEVKFWEAIGEGHCFHLRKPESDQTRAQDEVISILLNNL
ncbi:2-hydroxyisoflavanone dehydratase-like protein [Carex littledalei]|uniref:2-hydroxyisoflavanone dehydratase-like protein n=1 Tax=Carex littledalei TaxID=544730 RepID=A0A833RPF6_9POAL|nr:2-hydroxyisoflavanone dehydratase-like protein [Carex littledalei]